MNNKGWECPKCGVVYAPFVSRCSGCTKSEIGDDFVFPDKPTCIHANPLYWSGEGSLTARYPSGVQPFTVDQCIGIGLTVGDYS